MAAPPPPPALQSVGRAAAPAQRLRIVHGGVWSEENVLTQHTFHARLAAASRRKRKPIESRSSCPHCEQRKRSARIASSSIAGNARDRASECARVQVHVNNSITHPSIFSPHIVYTRIYMDTGRNGFDEYTTTRAGPLFSFSRISWTRTRGRLAIHPR